MSTAKPKYPTFDIPFPAGRFVLGSLTELQTKDNNGRDRKNPTLFVAVAVDKRTPGIDDILGNIIGYARHTYQYVNGGQQVQQRLAQPNFAAKSGFAWKIKDGDHDPKWAAREGCPGSWIFCFGTSYAPARCCDTNFQQIDARVIGLGDWVQVFSTVAINGETGETAGLYLNPNGVMFLGTGQRIIPAGQSFEQMFAGRVGQLPPGAQPPQAAPGQAYGQPAPNYAPQGQQAAPGYAPPPQVGGYAPPLAAAPNGGYTPSPGAQNVMAAQQGQPPQYAPPAGPQMASPNMGQYQPPSGGYPPAGGHPATHMPPGGGAHGAYPSSIPNGAYAPAAPAGGPYTGAPSGVPGQQPATAYPSNAYTPPPGPAPGGYQPPAGVQPNYGFVNGPQR
jgi:hypothetical protein